MWFSSSYATSSNSSNSNIVTCNIRDAHEGAPLRVNGIQNSLAGPAVELLTCPPSDSDATKFEKLTVSIYLSEAACITGVL